ncbi:hypothetical protein [Acidimangrovimonas pyrenivorans]|uniref:Uncharacterized protein n=1 Tax=Acidimangrovimonas pyrenivorans TaxID=2030798 RepID=A0ABV7AHA1_9RHOB
MTEQPDPMSLRAIVLDAVKREAATDIDAGKVLFDGSWIPREELKSKRRQRLLRNIGRTLEALVFWLAVAGAGILLMLLASIIV